MNTNRTILLVGACGSGKTWVMKSLIERLNLNSTKKFKMIFYQTNGEVSVLGKYDGSTFEGSDKLSMAVARDFKPFKNFNETKNYKIIAEGDRFMNSTFIETFQPYIIKIKDKGQKGRLKRNSSQTERQIKTIQTRVDNVKENVAVNDSTEALELIINILK